MDKLLSLKKVFKDAVAPDPLAQYKLAEGSGRAVGPHRLIKALDAVDRSSGEKVTVMVCHLPSVHERCGGNLEEAARVTKRLREGIHLMTKLRHPAILRVVTPLVEDKSRDRFVYVTERVDAWLDSVAGGDKEQRDAPLSSHRVETTFGMHQIGDALDFLHSKAGILLQQLSPYSIVVTQSGDWKLGDMTHAFQFSDDAVREACTASPLLFKSLSAPLLDFCAPEVVEFHEACCACSSSIALQQGAAPPVMQDLFSEFHTSSSQEKKGNRPAFPDSDIFSFIVTTLFVVERKRLLNSGGEVSVYRRQLADANQQVKTLFPKWGALLDCPRLPLAHILQTEVFAAKEVRLLAEIKNLVSMEPREKLTILKGFHDQIAHGSLPPSILQRVVLPPLVQEMEDERMIKYIVPILLEASGELPKAMFDVSLRTCVSGMMGRGVKARASASATVDSIGLVVLAQILDKFSRIWQHYNTAKEIQQELRPLLCAGLCCGAQGRDTVKSALAALHLLLSKVERPFANCDEVARDVLTAVISCPDDAPRAMGCLQRLLPFTTREGREAELEPKLVAGIVELSKATAVVASEVDQLLKVMMSIVAESSEDHAATVTLPLLCPLLVLRHAVVRNHISTYVNQLVQLVIAKKKKEDESDVQNKEKQLALVRAPSVSEFVQRSAAVHDTPSASATSFFELPKVLPPATSASSVKNRMHEDPFGDFVQTSTGSQGHAKQKAPDELRDAFGF